MWILLENQQDKFDISDQKLSCVLDVCARDERNSLNKSRRIVRLQTRILERYEILSERVAAKKTGSSRLNENY